MRYARLAWLLAILLALGGCAAAIVTGAGAGIMAAEDRRTVATMTEDESIELKNSQRVSEKVAGNVHLNVTSYNRMVLLTFEKTLKESKVLLVDNEQKILSSFDVPAEAKELYRALRHAGVATELVLYPREGHGVAERAHQIDFATRFVDWFDQHVKK